MLVHRGKIAGQQSAKLEAQILAAARQTPKDGSTHWSTRKLAAELGTNHTRVARVLAKAGLQPHRLRRYLASNDPDFETKAADIIGLYLKPPVNAAVFCVDEKSAIQALDRLDPVLPLSPGSGCRRKPRGNLLPGAGWNQSATSGVMTSGQAAGTSRTRGWEYSQSGTPAKKASWVLRRFAPFRQMATACTTWRAMFGSGAATGTGSTFTLRPQVEACVATPPA